MIKLGDHSIPIDPRTGEPRLLQTRWWRDPWRVATTSILLIATDGSRVRDMLDRFYELYPDPEELILRVDRSEPLLRPLGLANRRATMLVGFSADYLRGTPVRHSIGVGPYVDQAYRIVHLKDAYCPTEDKSLLIYRWWLQSLPEDPLRWA